MPQKSMIKLYNIKSTSHHYTDSLTVYITTGDIYKDIAEDSKTRFDTSNFELDRPLSKGKIKN